MIQQPHFGHTFGKDENSYLKRYNHPNVHSNIMYNSQEMEDTCVY